MTAPLTRVLGLMTGTSLDGVDAAIIETDGENDVRPGPGLFIEFKPDIRADLAAATARALELGRFVAGDPVIQAGEKALTAICAEAVAALAVNMDEKPDLIGFHGQTVLHAPERGLTWQIGDGARLARMTGYPVVWDFRSEDVAHGGQGAPFAPLYHRALVHSAGLAGPVAVLNIGGVANLTYVDGDDILAFDTGPGNGLIDQWVQRHSDRMFDAGGGLAAGGLVDPARLATMLADDWFDAPPPKSLDRYQFTLAPVDGLSLEDGAATLAAFTIESIFRALAHLPRPPTAWYVCGGGRKNTYLLKGLRDKINVKFAPVEDLGWRGDLLEAEAFAYLAARSKRGLPLSLPETTGVARPLTGGRLSLPL